MWLTSLAFVTILSTLIVPSLGNGFDPSVCGSNTVYATTYRTQIQDASFQRDLRRVSDRILRKEAGSTYEAVASFVDRYGARPVGSQNLKDSIIDLAQFLASDLPNEVKLDPLVVPRWTRGREEAGIIEPFSSPLTILGFMGSVGTDGQTLISNLLIVRSAHDLLQRRNEIRDRFVLLNFSFNQTADPITDQFGGYGPAYKYATEQTQQASNIACQFGAKALFVRSLTDVSLNTPHTEYQFYLIPTCRIPVVALTIEDTNKLDRILRRGQVPKIKLYTENKLYEKPDISKNIVGKLNGYAQNDPEVILITGKIDSVDVGQGVVDNAAGTLVFTQGVQTLIDMIKEKKIPPPKKTIKLAIFTGSEVGGRGVRDYVNRYNNLFQRHVLALGSNKGVFNPFGMTISSNIKNDILPCIMHEILDSCNLNVSRIGVVDPFAENLETLQDCGIPVSTLINNNTDYLTYRNSPADTMEALSSIELDRTRAMVTCLTYGLSRLSGSLIFEPRSPQAKCPVLYPKSPVIVQPPPLPVPVAYPPMSHHEYSFHPFGDGYYRSKTANSDKKAKQ